jgi:hypothetical protein
VVKCVVKRGKLMAFFCDEKHATFLNYFFRFFHRDAEAALPGGFFGLGTEV